MKKFKIQKVTGLLLTIMLAITVIIMALFYFGGEAPVDQRVVADTSMSEPLYTDAIIYWNYILFGLGIIAMVGGALYQFGSTLKDSPKEALKSLVGIALLVVVLAVTWAMGDTTPLVMPGYEGTENVPFWLKVADMFLYTIYVLMGLAVALMVGFGIARRFR